MLKSFKTRACVDKVPSQQLLQKKTNDAALKKQQQQHYLFANVQSRKTKKHI